MQSNSVEELITAENTERKQLRQTLLQLQQQLSSSLLSQQQQHHLSIRILTLKQHLTDLSNLPSTPNPNPSSNPTPAASISLSRLEHLSSIFKHYCTHIFRTGKHMTFQRLEYEKEHMTIDRFFIFLKDFKLTVLEGKGKVKEVLGRDAVLRIFKKVSPNGKDLNFQQFIECLDRLAVAYYDQRELYQDKLRENQDKRVKEQENAKRMALLKEEEDRKAKEVKANLEEEKKKAAEWEKQNQKEQPRDLETSEVKIDPKQRQGNSWKDEDDFANINREDLKKNEDQQKQVQEKQLNTHTQFQNVVQQPIHPPIKQIPKEQTKKIEAKSFSTPRNEKIEAFYKIIGVDSVKDYQTKLSQLNLPIFKPTKNKSSVELKRSPAEQTSAIVLSDDEQMQRINQIKRKLSQQRALAILKSKTPKKPDQPNEHNDFYLYNQNRKQRLLRQKQRILRVKKARQQIQQQLSSKQLEPSTPRKPHPHFKQHKVIFSELQQLNFEQVVPADKQFHPHMLYDIDPEDEKYMGDLKFDAKNIEKYKLLEKIQRKAEGVALSTRKRASEMQREEKGRSVRMEKVASRRQSNSKILV